MAVAIHRGSMLGVVPTYLPNYREFYQRFFANQFKRSVPPNGPKMSHGGSLSPRSDWRAPSDGVANAWLTELAANVPENT